MCVCVRMSSCGHAVKSRQGGRDEAWQFMGFEGRVCEMHVRRATCMRCGASGHVH